VQGGDTWRDIAKRYYGDESRAGHPALRAKRCEARQLARTRGAPAAHSRTPFGTSCGRASPIVNIAELYYGSRDEVRARCAPSTNAKGRLTRGHMLLVPLFDLVLSPEGRRRVEESHWRAHRRRRGARAAGR
jgi:hypothetical protein